jgi:N-acetylglucosaminyldiphosphoundecaprenol N-acetyl-beta-D-mannosaminyltransferase
MPLVWYLKNIYNIRQERIAGMDLLPELLSRAEVQDQSVYFYGGTEEMLAKTRAYIEKKFPGLAVAGTYSPPFRNLTPEEKENVISRINRAAPTWVFVVLGCPKQEEWMASMKGAIKAVMVGVGGALPVMVGMQRRAPVWMQNIGCEWLFRLWQEPKRLWKRYGVTNSLFLYLFMKEFVQRKIFRKPFAAIQ